MITVKLIRHSERLDAKKPLQWMTHVGSYWADTPLTPDGFKMTKEKAIYIKNINPKYNPMVLYTSPYLRTMSTATEINKIYQQSIIVIEPLLAEYQGSFKHNITLYPDGIPTEISGQFTGFTYPEKYDNFSERIKMIMINLLEKSSGDIMIITHGEVVKVWLSNLQQFFPEIRVEQTDVNYLTVLSFDYDTKSGEIDPKSIKIE